MNKRYEVKMTLPTWVVIALANGDVETLSKDEVKSINNFLGRYPDITVPCVDIDAEKYFRSCNDVDNFAGDVVDCACLI